MNLTLLQGKTSKIARQKQRKIDIYWNITELFYIFRQKGVVPAPVDAAADPV
ncbi:MAG: hypothetical protein PUD80_02115 [Firmicutes bacterium]|nr:hypothetical protein [Bacillota bacterium]